MKLKNKNILLISPEPWNHIFVSKHHYATYLAEKGNQVFFLNPPSSKEFVIETEHNNVYSVFYKGFLKGLRFFPSSLQKYIISKKYDQLQHLCKVKFDVVWSFDNSVFFDFSALPKYVISISHIVDLNQNFQFAKAAKTANLCIGVIPKIVDKFKRYNSNSILIRHAVQDFPKDIKNIKLQGKNEIKVLYMGNLEMPYIDWDAIYLLAKTHKNIDFIFVGINKNAESPYWKKISFELDNVYHKTQVEALEIPHYLLSADLLLLAYTKEYFQEYASPHKMMEYLASGKMIFSSYQCEFKELLDEDLLRMYTSKGDLLKAFMRVIKDLKSLNSLGLMNKRRFYVTDKSYNSKIDQIETLLSDFNNYTFF